MSFQLSFLHKSFPTARKITNKWFFSAVCSLVDLQRSVTCENSSTIVTAIWRPNVQFSFFLQQVDHICSWPASLRDFSASCLSLWRWAGRVQKRHRWRWEQRKRRPCYVWLRRVPFISSFYKSVSKPGKWIVRHVPIRKMWLHRALMWKINSCFLQRKRHDSKFDVYGREIWEQMTTYWAEWK